MSQNAIANHKFDRMVSVGIPLLRAIYVRDGARAASDLWGVWTGNEQADKPTTPRNTRAVLLEILCASLLRWRVADAQSSCDSSLCLVDCELSAGLLLFFPCNHLQLFWHHLSSQLVEWIRKKNLSVHRWIGRACIVSAVAQLISGGFAAVHNKFGPHVTFASFM